MAMVVAEDGTPPSQLAPCLQPEFAAGLVCASATRAAPLAEQKLDNEDEQSVDTLQPADSGSSSEMNSSSAAATATECAPATPTTPTGAARAPQAPAAASAEEEKEEEEQEERVGGAGAAGAAPPPPERDREGAVDAEQLHLLRGASAAVREPSPPPCAGQRHGAAARGAVATTTGSAGAWAGGAVDAEHLLRGAGAAAQEPSPPPPCAGQRHGAAARGAVGTTTGAAGVGAGGSSTSSEAQTQSSPDELERNSVLCSTLALEDGIRTASAGAAGSTSQELGQRSDSHPSSRNMNAGVGPETADVEQRQPMSDVLSLQLCHQSGDVSARVRLRSITPLHRMMVAAVKALQLGQTEDVCFSAAGRKLRARQTPASLKLPNDSTIVVCKMDDCGACRSGALRGHGTAVDQKASVGSGSTGTLLGTAVVDTAKPQRRGGMGWQQYRAAMLPSLKAQLEERWQRIARDSHALELLAWRHDRCSSGAVLPGTIASRLSAELDALIAKRSHDAETQEEGGAGAVDHLAKRARTGDKQSEVHSAAASALLARLGLDAARMPSPVLLFLKLARDQHRAGDEQLLPDEQAQEALSRWARLSSPQRRGLWALVAREAGLTDQAIATAVARRRGGARPPAAAPAAPESSSDPSDGSDALLRLVLGGQQAASELKLEEGQGAAVVPRRWPPSPPWLLPTTPAPPSSAM